ncbi:stalk domain-containing protein [Clostridium butyricum]
MIRKNLFRGIPFCLALGLMITPVISAHAEAYGTGLTKSAIKDEIDPGFMIKPEIFVNNKELNSEDVKILNSEAYLPLEKVAFSMGDRLEGSYEDAYMLRKSDKMINMDIKNNKYRVNGIESNVKFEVIDNTVYVPIRFLSDVLGYNMGYEGNCIYIGEGSEQYNENANGEVNVDLSGDNLIDDAMMLNPEIYINSDKYPDFGVKVYDGKVYLPLETVTLKMGDRLEGDISTEYYLRKII